MVGMYLFINSYARGMKVPAVIMCNECNFPGRMHMAKRYGDKKQFYRVLMGFDQLPAII